MLKPHVESGSVTVIGVVQEQHPDRARLYAQWRRLGWPIFVDSLNLLDLAVVPVPIAIDASGIVRHKRISSRAIVEEFLETGFPIPSVPASYNRAPVADVKRLRERAQTLQTAVASAPRGGRSTVRRLLGSTKKLQTAKAWRDLGDACFLTTRGLLPARTSDLNDACNAVEAYRKAVALDPTDGRAQFRLGVALRRRSESRNRRTGDAQAAVEQWGLALAIDPNQYIWRRRIQQYGPRLDKPYNFYFWVEQARKEIEARGETPVTLSVEPVGSEIAPPARRGQTASRGLEPARTSTHASRCGSQADRIQRDIKHFVSIEPMVTPARVRPGHRVRARVTFRVNQKTRPYWNNEADDLTMCIGAPNAAVQVSDDDGATLREGAMTYPNPQAPETQELRALEFELTVAKTAKTGTLEVPAFALYYVCGNKGGKCRYLRQDFSVPVTIDPAAPTIR